MIVGLFFWVGGEIWYVVPTYLPGISSEIYIILIIIMIKLVVGRGVVFHFMILRPQEHVNVHAFSVSKNQPLAHAP